MWRDAMRAIAISLSIFSCADKDSKLVNEVAIYCTSQPAVQSACWRSIDD